MRCSALQAVNYGIQKKKSTDKKIYVHIHSTGLQHGLPTLNSCQYMYAGWMTKRFPSYNSKQICLNKNASLIFQTFLCILQFLIFRRFSTQNGAEKGDKKMTPILQPCIMEQKALQILLAMYTGSLKDKVWHKHLVDGNFFFLRGF